MGKEFIKSNLEFFDVISAFPALKEILVLKNIDVGSIKEGTTVYDFLKKESMTEKEIEVFIRKLNVDLNNYLGEENLEVLKPIVLEEKELTLEEFDKIEEEE